MSELQPGVTLNPDDMGFDKELERRQQKDDEFKKRVEYYKEHPEEIGIVPKTPEEYVAKHPEVVKEVGHQTVEAVDPREGIWDEYLDWQQKKGEFADGVFGKQNDAVNKAAPVDPDQAWQDYGEGKVDPALAEQREALAEYEATQAEIVADEKKARQEKQFNDALYHWLGVDRPKNLDGTPDEIIDSATQNWRNHMGELILEAENDLKEGRISKEEYDARVKKYTDKLVNDFESHEQLMSPPIAPGEKGNIKLSLKDYVNKTGQLIESDTAKPEGGEQDKPAPEKESGTKKGFLAKVKESLGRISDKAKRAAIIAAASVMALTMIGGLVYVASQRSGNNNVPGNNNSNTVQAEWTYGGPGDFNNMMDAADRMQMSPEDMADGEINTAIEQAERDMLRHEYEYENADGETVEGAFVENDTGYNRENDPFNSEVGQGIGFKENRNSLMPEFRGMDAYMNMLNQDARSQTFWAGLLGLDGGAKNMTELNDISDDLEADQEAFAAYRNNVMKNLAQYMNGGKENRVEFSGAYRTMYGAATEDRRVVYYPQAHQYRAEISHGLDFINQDGESLLNSEKAHAFLKEFFALPDGVEINQALIREECGQIILITQNAQGKVQTGIERVKPKPEIPPAQEIPDEPVPDEPVPDEPIPDEPIPDEPIPDEPEEPEQKTENAHGGTTENAPVSELKSDAITETNENKSTPAEEVGGQDVDEITQINVPPVPAEDVQDNVNSQPVEDNGTWQGEVESDEGL